MKKSTISLMMALVSASAMATADNSFYDKARVVKVEPIYEWVQVNQPEEQCWNEKVYHRGYGRSATPAITGAIIGGAVGNRVGRGNGKKVMTIAGALLGASVGNDIARENRHGYVTRERRCEVVDRYQEHEELTGYRVKYHYHGKSFWTTTNEDPGDYLRVMVDVSPADGYRDH